MRYCAEDQKGGGDKRKELCAGKATEISGVKSQMLQTENCNGGDSALSSAAKCFNESREP